MYKLGELHYGIPVAVVVLTSTILYIYIPILTKYYLNLTTIIYTNTHVGICILTKIVLWPDGTTSIEKAWYELFKAERKYPTTSLDAKRTQSRFS